MRDLPAWLYDRRHWAGAIFLIVTALFAYELRNLDIATQFRDLYPQNSEAIRLLDKYPAFGSPFTETILIKVKHGDIYNPATLSKIQEATRLADLIPGVDHNQVISIASRRVRHMEAVVGGIQSSNLLIGPVPQSQSELDHLRERVRSTPGVTGTLVSFNGDAALIQATFIDRLVDYKVIFDQTNRILNSLQDSNHDAYAFGQPMLTGWVYHYRRQTFVMFTIGLAAMVVLLAFYFRNLPGVLVPTLVGCVSAVWGFGLAGLLGFNLDPLIVVVPILLVARALSHSVQMCERYFELYHERRDVPWALKTSLSSLFAPGVGGIVCDAAGIFLIGLAPVPLIRKLAIIGGFWSLSLVFTAILLSFLLLSYLPAPGNVDELIFSSEKKHGILYRIFTFISFFSSNQKRAAATVGFFVVLAVVSGVVAKQREVGDSHPGSSLLWPDSPYNLAIEHANRGFAGSDVLQIVLESDHRDGVKSAAALDFLLRLQRYMEMDPAVGSTLSFADNVAQGARLFHGGALKWTGIPEQDSDSAAVSELIIGRASPGDFDRFITPTFSASAISIWYRDHSESTIAGALERAEAFIASTRSTLGDHFRVRLASGTLGLRGANDAIVGKLEITTVAIISVLIFVVTTLMYRSITAGALLVIVADIAYLLTGAFMKLKGIGLDVNTFPVAAVGIGIGIDYNIYLMSRLCEDYNSHANYSALVSASIFTTGKAIFSTATTMVVGMSIWYFLSGLKFQAEMGLLLSFVMIAHVVLALFFQAAAVQLIQPKFVEAGSGLHSVGRRKPNPRGKHERGETETPMNVTEKLPRTAAGVASVLVILAMLAIAKPAEAQLHYGPLSVTGYYQTTLSIPPTEDANPNNIGLQAESGKPNFLLGNQYLNVSLLYDLSEQLKLYVEPRAYHDFTKSIDDHYRQYESFPRDFAGNGWMGRVGGNDAMFELGQAYLDYRNGNLSVRAGKQSIAWGEAAGVQILDIVEPLDLSQQFFFNRALEEFDHYRIAEWFLKTDYTIPNRLIPDLTTEVLVNPGQVVPTLDPAQGSPFNVFPAIFKYQEHVTQGQPTIGVRVSGTAGPSEFSLNFLSQPTASGVALVKGALGPAGSPPFLLEGYHPRIEMYGGSLNYNWDWAGALLRFETSIIPNTRFVNATDTQMVQRPEIKAYAEIDRPISWNSEFEELSVTGSFLETYNAGDTQGAFAGGKRIHTADENLILFLVQPLFRSRVSFEAFALYDPQDAWWAQAGAHWEVGNHVRLDAFYNQFAGAAKDVGYFGAFHWASGSFFRFTYGF